MHIIMLYKCINRRILILYQTITLGLFVAMITDWYLTGAGEVLLLDQVLRNPHHQWGGRKSVRLGRCQLMEYAAVVSGSTTIHTHKHRLTAYYTYWLFIMHTLNKSYIGFPIYQQEVLLRSVTAQKIMKSKLMVGSTSLQTGQRVTSLVQQDQSARTTILVSEYTNGQVNDNSIFQFFWRSDTMHSISLFKLDKTPFIWKLYICYKK